MTTIESLVTSVIIAFVLFVATQIIIGFFRQMGSTGADRLTSPNNQSRPPVYVEGEDFEVELDEDGGLTITTTNINEENNLKTNKKIIVEGLFDRQVLQAVLNYYCEYSENNSMYPCDASIIVAQGVSRIPRLIEWAEHNGQNYWAILDNDAGAERVYDQLDEAGDINSKRVLVVGRSFGQESATTLIDLFSDSFLEDCTSTFDKEQNVDRGNPALVNEITSRLRENREVEVEDVKEFRCLLWKVNAG